MILLEATVQLAREEFLPLKHGLVINKEYRNSDFNIITENEALEINLELSNNQPLLWQPFTARMEILTSHFFNPLITFLLMSCL